MTMLTQFSMGDLSGLTEDQVTVSQVPVTVLNPSEATAEPQSYLVNQPRVKVDQQQTEAASAAEVVELDSADSVMSNWDDEIWAEESAASVVADHGNSQNVEQQRTSATGWMAGIAATTPALFRRRSNKKD